MSGTTYFRPIPNLKPSLTKVNVHPRLQEPFGKKVPGHMQVGQELALVMDKFFDTDAGAVLEKDIFDAIGSDNADCDDLIERLSPCDSSWHRHYSLHIT